jgi:DNA-binding NtrC family response regulator
VYLTRPSEAFSLENLENPESIDSSASFDNAPLRPQWKLLGMIGRSPSMQHLFGQMRCTAEHLRLAAIEGEPGTGKTLVAKTLHTLSRTAAAPFVYSPAAGFFDNAQHFLKQAQGGTLYLARIHQISADQQSRFLDLLDWLEHQRARASDFPAPSRILVGSAHSLRRLTASNTMRSDLAHRLTAIRFALPPMRERREDLPLLAEVFLHRFRETHGKPVRGLAPGSLSRLFSHTWPGNVRELESIISTAALDCEGQWIRPIDIPAFNPTRVMEQASAVEIPSDDPNLDRAIFRHIARVLARVNGNKLRAARLLGISRSTLYRMLESEGSAT